MRHMGFVTTKIMIIIKLSWNFSVANLKMWTSSGFFLVGWRNKSFVAEQFKGTTFFSVSVLVFIIMIF